MAAISECFGRCRNGTGDRDEGGGCGGEEKKVEANGNKNGHLAAAAEKGEPGETEVLTNDKGEKTEVVVLTTVSDTTPAGEKNGAGENGVPNMEKKASHGTKDSAIKVH